MDIEVYFHVKMFYENAVSVALLPLNAGLAAIDSAEKNAKKKWALFKPVVVAKLV